MSTTLWLSVAVFVLGVLGEWGEHGWRRALRLLVCCLVFGGVIAALPSGPVRVYAIVGAIVVYVLLRAREHDRARAARAS